MSEAPVILVPCVRARDMPPREALPAPVAARYEAHLAYQERIRGASIYPAVQNIILACRALGLGTVITTNHLIFEPEVRQVLGLPSEIQTHALMPIGYPRGRFGPVRRRPAKEVAMLDRFGNAWSD